MSPQRRRRRRGSLTPELVLNTAFSLAEEHGLASFTMPELAAHLDVGVTGLYWHYRTKDELIRAMSIPAMTRLDSLMMRPDGEDPRQWRDFLTRYFRRLRSVYNENPVLADIMLTRPSPHDEEAVTVAYSAVDELIAYLISAELTRETAFYVFSTALHFTQSTVIAELARARHGKPVFFLQDTDRLRQLGWSTLATLTADNTVELDMTGERAFRVGLEMIVSGAQPEKSQHTVR